MEVGSLLLVVSVARVPLAWTVSRQTHNKAHSIGARDKSTGPVRSCHVIEHLADVSDAADKLSVGSVVRRVHTIFQLPLKRDERSFSRWKIPLGEGTASLLGSSAPRLLGVCPSSCYTAYRNGEL
jgi:hypothetical protein